jgi:hypothetical protein
VGEVWRFFAEGDPAAPLYDFGVISPLAVRPGPDIDSCQR